VAIFDIAGVVESFFSKILGPSFSKLVTQVKAFVDHAVNIFKNLDTLVESIKSEAEAWKTFRESIQVSNRVINIPKAYDQTKSLIVGLLDAWHAIVDIVRQFREKLGIQNAAADAEAAATDVEESGASSLLKRLPKLAKVFEKVLGVLTLVVDALASILSVIDDLQTIVDETKRIREEIESAESLFLQQKNPRKTVKLAAGGSMRIRVGSMHQLS
jgi:hypothetical protein